VRTGGSALGPAAGNPGNPGLSARELEQALGTLPLRFRGLVDRQARAADVEIDPLVSAGWKALLGMSFFTVLTVSAIGFLIHSRVSFKSRIGELALLRTIGLSMRQLLSLVLLEQALVIGTAIALGIFMGARLGATIMPYLANSGEGVRVAPPMLVQVDWAGFGATFGVIGGVFAFVVAVILISVYRMSIHRVMRMGEG
jgi:putative ABC transport system permease protein